MKTPPNADHKVVVLEKLLTVKQMQINSLLEISQAINNNFSVSALFRIYEFILRAQMGIQNLVVYIKNDEWDCVCNSSSDPRYISLDVEQELCGYKQIKVLDKEARERIGPFEFVIPVIHKHSPLAFILIGEVKTDDNDSIEENLKFIQTISNIVVVAIENKKLFKNLIHQEVMKNELSLAGKMQAMLFPESLPKNEVLEMDAVYLPHQDIGGDYYDVIDLNDEEMAFCIGDISGKGIPAAILMANFQASLTILIGQKGDMALDQFIRVLNDRVVEITKGEKFITLFLGIFNKNTRELQYINAGHNPPILYEKGDVSFLEKGCTLLGMFPSLPAVKIGKVPIRPETVLINYTDGVVDLENVHGEFYEMDRLINFVKDNAHLNMPAFNEQLTKTLEEYKSDVPYTDDVSLLSILFH